MKSSGKDYLRRYYLQHRAQILERSRRYYHTHKLEILRKGQVYRQSSHGRAMLIARKYGIPLTQAETLLGIPRCEICGRVEILHTDHDHRTRRVRGRLCMRCNLAMGAFQDSPEILRKAVAYLELRQ